MAKTYSEKTNDLGWEYIELLDSDKPESITVIPKDEGNSDYQRYLRWLENPDADEAQSL
jgi:hypothetical protein